MQLTLCKSGSISSSGVRPSPMAITLFLPKKNLLGFHCSRTSFIFSFLILRKLNRYTLLYFCTQLRTSSTIRCLRARPFLSVLVSETVMIVLVRLVQCDCYLLLTFFVPFRSRHLCCVFLRDLTEKAPKQFKWDWKKKRLTVHNLKKARVLMSTVKIIKNVIF